MKTINDFLHHKTFKTAFNSASSSAEKQMLFDYVSKYKSAMFENIPNWIQPTWEIIRLHNKKQKSVKLPEIIL